MTRTDDEIRVDLDIWTHDCGNVGVVSCEHVISIRRQLHAEHRLAGDAGPLLDRAVAAEQECAQLRDRVRFEQDNRCYGNTHVFLTPSQAEAELAAVRAEVEAIWVVVHEYLPQAIGHNTLPEIVAGIARQRDGQHEIKDHLAFTAQRLTTELAAAQQRLAAVEKLHTPYPKLRELLGDTREQRCARDSEHWPCQTYDALAAPDVAPPDEPPNHENAYFDPDAAFDSTIPDVVAIRRRWSRYGGMGNERSDEDYTDAGCRILLQSAWRDIDTLLSLIPAAAVAPVPEPEDKR